MDLSYTRIVIAGHVDHGKSTLVGRLLSDSGQIFQERIEKVKKICESNGKQFEFAFLLDAFEEEQKEGITIDKTEIPWTYKGKEFLIIDTPGHKEFLKNMISGASTAEIALIMLDAKEGIREQFKRHAYIIGMLGIKNIIVVINKMDLVNYSQTHFEKLEREALNIFNELKIKASYIIPVSAFAGENLLKRSESLSWFKGPHLADSLLTINARESVVNDNLRFSLQDVYKFDENRIYAGKIESGSLAVGDEIKFLPSGSSSRIKSIESWNVKVAPTEALAGTSVGFTLTDPLFLERGEIGYKPTQSKPTVTHQMHASLFWMSNKQLEIGKNYKFKMLTQESECKIESIFKVFNPQNMGEGTSTDSLKLDPGEAAEVIIKLQKNIVCDAFSDFENTGRFVLLDDHRIVGGGVVLKANTINVFKESSHLSSQDRSMRFGHQGAVLWLTGLSGAGKSTIAKVLEKRLFEMNAHSIVLDGDNLRKGICKDLGFSPEDRKENIRRTAEVSKLISESGSVAIAALISPLKSDRQMARKLMGELRFIEIFVDCSLEECERRDTKGLYKKARKGEILGFTGVGSEYESPTKAEIIIDSSLLDPEASVDLIIQYMKKNNILGQNKI
ncbi:MAG: adenylyl-sulfate kinase [Bacteriovorax sp.]|nr:adenylyl-sulfate kinase [Bacteriovorax sp.]